MGRHKKCPGVTATLPGRDTEKESRENRTHYTAKEKSCQAKRGRVRMEEKPGYWAVIPAEVRYDAALPPMARLLYAEISALTGQNGYCYACNAYFQALYGVTERTVQNLLRALQASGYIRILDGTGGAQRRKIYAGVNPLGDNPEKNCGGTPKKFSGGPEKKCGGNNKSNKKENNSPQPPKGGAGELWDPEAFEAFWSLYPKKRDKKTAIREWNKLKADRNLMRSMAAALRAQMASEEWLRDNGRAIPYPCRWLSHRRWEDELPVETAQALRAEEGPEWI